MTESGEKKPEAQDVLEILFFALAYDKMDLLETIFNKTQPELIPLVEMVIREIERKTFRLGFLKFYSLLNCCMANSKTESGEELISRKYLMEKAERVLHGVPIILDRDAIKFYEQLKKESIYDRFKH